MTQIEGQITLALQAFEQGQFSSLRAAARAYEVSHATLSRRSKGTPSRSVSTCPNLKLTQTSETTLVQWILSMDTRGTPPTQALGHEMGELLLTERVRNTSDTVPKLGVHGVYRFSQRHPELQSITI
jgi:hypothetical protein